jgi:putative inorganic carbon (HCO3(-)) transporter
MDSFSPMSIGYRGSKSIFPLLACFALVAVMGILAALLRENAWWLVILALAAVVFFISWIDFSSGLILYIALVMLVPKALGLPIPGLLFSTLSPSRVLLIALALPRIITLVQGRLGVRRTRLDKWIALVIGATLITLPFSIGLYVSVPRFVGQLLEYWLLFYLVIDNLRTLPKIQRVISGLLAIVGIVTLIGIFEIFSGQNLYRDIVFVSRSDLWDWPAGRFVPGTGLSRALGPFEHPIAFGVILAMMIPLALWYVQTVHGRVRWILLFLLTTMSVCLLATVSRLAWIAAVVGIFASSNLSVKKRLIAAVVVFAISLIPVPVTSGTGQMSIAQVVIESLNIMSPGEGLNESAVGRLALVGSAIELVQARPVFGYGLSISKTLWDPNSPFIDLRSQIGASENQYLVYFVDLGIVGAAAWLLLEFTVIRFAWQVARSTKLRQAKSLASALFASIIVYYVSLLGVGGYYQQIDPLFWILVAIVVSLGTMDSRFKVMSTLANNA